MEINKLELLIVICLIVLGISGYLIFNMMTEGDEYIEDRCKECEIEFTPDEICAQVITPYYIIEDDECVEKENPDACVPDNVNIDNQEYKTYEDLESCKEDL